MVALNFKAEFADAVATGRKTQTIRKTARCKPGDALQLYTGQRTKQCRKLGDATCWRVQTILITDKFITVDDFPLSNARSLRFAERDGFHGPNEMRKFFADQYGLPFEGYVIRWRLCPQDTTQGEG